MSWTNLTPYKNSWTERGSTIAVQKLWIAIRISSTLMKQAGWQPGNILAVLCGDDEHRGMVRLERATEGWSLLAQNKHRGELHVILRVKRTGGAGRRFPDLPDALPSTPIGTTLTKDGAVEFWLPWVQRRFNVHDVAARDGGVVKLSRPATAVETRNVLA